MDSGIRQNEQDLNRPDSEVTGAVSAAKKDGVRFSFHITPAALSFCLALATALIGLIVWLTDKPSRAEVNDTIDRKQLPVIERLDDLKSSVRDFRKEFHDYRLIQDGVKTETGK